MSSTCSNPGNRGDRARALLTADGASSLQDIDLLALLIGAGGVGRDTIVISRELIDRFGGLEALRDASCVELVKVKGVGRAKAAAIIAGLELGRRSLAGAVPGARLGSSSDVYNAFWPDMACERTEVFSCAMVDAKLRLMRTEVISKGTLTASIVHPRESFRPAVRNAASGVIFAHNHPSGDPVPSDEDRRITGRLEEVGGILGIPMLDHVIVGCAGAYYSFADAGDLEAHSAGYRGMVLR